MIPAELAAAINDRLDDDTPRLAAADWLDENSETVPCPRCTLDKPPRNPPGLAYRQIGNYIRFASCDHCRGSGSVSDGRAEYGEFIRVQVELARTPCKCQDCAGLDPDIPIHLRSKRLTDLRERERELWNFGLRGTWVDTLYPPFECILCIGEETVSRERASDPILVVARGFPSVARLSLAALVGGEPCGRCGGGGDIGVEDGLPGLREETCPACSGTGRTPGLGKQLGAVIGLTGITLTNVADCLEQRGHTCYWRDDVIFDHDPRLPAAICPREEFASIDAAHRALSEKCLDWARGQALSVRQPA